MPELPAERVRRTHIADDVFEALARMIISGELQPEETLPPERDLAARFDVSRLIVRQAVHRLADIGLVRVRQGGATTIIDPAECDDPQVGVLALQWSPEREDLLTALRERQIAGSLGLLVLAARRATKTDLLRLRALLDDFELHPGDVLALNEAFWTAVGEITGNSFFRRDTRFWFRISRPLLTERASLPSEVWIEGYRRIIDHLDQGAEAAVRGYVPMVESLLDLIGRQRKRTRRTARAKRLSTRRAAGGRRPAAAAKKAAGQASASPRNAPRRKASRRGR